MVIRLDAFHYDRSTQCRNGLSFDCVDVEPLSQQHPPEALWCYCTLMHWRWEQTLKYHHQSWDKTPRFELKRFYWQIHILCKVQITPVMSKKKTKNTDDPHCILVCFGSMKNVELNKIQFLYLGSVGPQVQAQPWALASVFACALCVWTHVCCTYGSCVCVSAGISVGERCLSTNISACFRYWSVRLITDSLRFWSGSPGWTDTKEEES